MKRLILLTMIIIWVLGYSRKILRMKTAKNMEYCPYLLSIATHYLYLLLCVCTCITTQHRAKHKCTMSKEMTKLSKLKQWVLYNVKYWLITRKFLWKKVVFDNGMAGTYYTRYDHRIYPYSHGMGNRGKNGDVNTVIDWQVYQLQWAYA